MVKGKTLGEWLDQLKDPAPRQRVAAAQAVRGFGRKGGLAVQALLTAARDQDAEVRSTALDTLRWLPQDVKAVPVLVGALRDQSPKVRLSAAETLDAYLFAVPEDVRQPAREPLLKALKDPVIFVRSHAAKALGWFPNDARQVVPALLQVLKDGPDEVRCAAESALGKLGPGARPAVPVLIRLLKRPTTAKEGVTELYQDLVRRNAALALGLITRGTDLAVKPLCEALNDRGFEVSVAAVTALGDIGPAAKGAIEPLKRLLGDDGRPQERIHAAASLARIDPSFVPSSVALLGKALKDKRDFVRHNAVDALRDVGPAAKAATPALVELLSDKDEVLANRAFDALYVIDRDALRRALKAKDRSIGGR